ncbi:glycerate kinase-like isoform X1 [Hylaeus anthracinus]|uniref:glycerate kinase-like isoform X1 n=1 Tax=Hylaeus anthracinus TaxID=313031 RepID=UPI0023B9DA02|nr:glycerate kinase-like isoform X1 [Hylaeus anthracinus]
MHHKRVLRKCVQYSSLIISKSNLLHFVKFSSRNMSTDNKILEESKSILKDMYFAGVKAVSPKALVINKVKFKDGILQVSDQSFPLKENVYLVGFGKAVMGMSIVLEYILGDRLKKGIVSVPSASTDAMWESEDKSYFPKLASSVVEYREGSVNNQPDDRCLNTTHDIIDLVESLTENDSLIVLISGGGSALLYMPRPIIDQEDKLLLCKTLQNAGADIKELNTVRMKLSMVKGGGLARMAYPASIITLILSDIVGDPIDLIASGPTVYNSKAPRQVIAVLKKYDLFDKLEGDVKKAITSKEAFKDKPLLTGRRKQKAFKHVNNIILGNNEVAVQAAALEAQRKQLTPIILRTDVTGNVHDVSLAYAHITSLICLVLDKTLEREEFFEKVKDTPVLSLPTTKVDEIYNLIENVSGEGIVLIGGGEPTVIVKGEGKGGRNQELALHFSLDWLAKIKSNPRFAEYDVIMLSAGTDGQDGPTDAAGAFGYPAIGPIIHDVYAKAKFLASEGIVQLEMKKEAIKKKEEERQQLEQQRPQEICKKHELSGFVILKKEDTQNKVKDDKVTEKEGASDPENADDLEEVLPLIYLTMEVERMLPENALNDNDTYNLYSRFKKGSELLKTGFTGTNVMDLHFIYIKKRKCDCKIDFLEKEVSENALDNHDLYIDPSTIERYRRMRTKIPFDWDHYLRRPTLIVKDEADHLNIKIIDDNLAEPCCRKDRKFPLKNHLKDKDLPL